MTKGPIGSAQAGAATMAGRGMAMGISRAHAAALLYGGPASVFGLSAALAGAAAMQRTTSWSLEEAVRYAIERT
jgi:hypothetical protein